MKKLLAMSLATILSVSISSIPAQAATCSQEDKKSVRALLVPVTTLSIWLGTNIEANAEVRAEIKSIRKNTNSKKLKRSLLTLDQMIQVGELRPGSSVFWGSGKNSVWDMYERSLNLTKKNGC